MIFFKPETDTDRLCELYKNITFTPEAVYCRYAAEQDSLEIGSILVKVQNGKCFILDIALTSGDPLNCEGLIRSALNFGANRGAYMAYTECAQYRQTLEYLGFALNDGVYSGEIPELLKGSCCK